MTYELAKELRDAGFPQAGDFWFTRHATTLLATGLQYRPFPEDRDLLCPTLEELIEACGEIPFTLVRDYPGNWVAHSIDAKTMRAGRTPREAVARLWLALNKK